MTRGNTGVEWEDYSSRKNILLVSKMGELFHALYFPSMLVQPHTQISTS